MRIKPILSIIIVFVFMSAFIIASCAARKPDTVIYEEPLNAVPAGSMIETTATAGAIIPAPTAAPKPFKIKRKKKKAVSAAPLQDRGAMQVFDSTGNKIQ